MIRMIETAIQMTTIGGILIPTIVPFVAEILSKKALEKKITKVYLDRGSYRYHGRIKIFAEALRKGGLTF